jgi:tetratricopeptide (TPR) repeat protein
MTVPTIRDAQHAFERGDCTRAEALGTQLVKLEPQNAAAWHVLGLARQKLGQLEPALEALNTAANQDRRVARYQHDLANALLDDGKIDRAISAFRRALRIDEGLAEAHNDLGAAYFQKGWHAEAEACFRKAVELKPDHGVAYANLGAALRALGRLGDSRRAYQRALLLKLRNLLPGFLRWRVAPGGRAAPPAASAEEKKLMARELQAIADHLGGGRRAEALQSAVSAEARYPQVPDVLHLHAVALEENGKPEEALAKVRAAIELKPDRTEYHLTCARILVRAFRPDDALNAAAEALRLEPGSAAVLAAIAGIYHPWREDLAVRAAQQAVEIDPASHLAHGNLAAALWGLSRLDEAEAHAREAVRLNPRQLGYRANLALILKDLDKLAEAQALYRTMVDEAPNYPKVCMDMGTLAIECEGDLEAARTWYRKAQSVSDNPRAFLSEAVVNLLDYRFDPGWQQYEARKRVWDQRYQQEPFERFAVWQGEPLKDERLLVYGEQGLGDEVMFASMFADLARRVKNVTVLCDARLGTLFSRSFPQFQIIAAPRDKFAEHAANLQGIDKAIAAGSLGQHFRRQVAEFPARAYLRTDPAKVERWRQKLEALGSGRKIGLSWIGGLQRSGRSRRSLTLEELRPLLSRDVHWISVQHQDVAAEIAAFDVPVHCFPEVLNDMDEMASLMAALDAVVSVCNTNVHVGGAIGEAVLVMAPFVPEWRYGLSGERMLWYPSVRVFRQSRYGDWNGVIDRIITTLTPNYAARTL